MVSDKAFAQEYADVTPAAAESHLLTDDEDIARNEIQISAGAAADSVEDTEDETIDLNAALGGGIRKAPAAADLEPEPTPAEIEQVISA
jgi:small subunit ribosomal protein S2